MTRRMIKTAGGIALGLLGLLFAVDCIDAIGFAVRNYKSPGDFVDIFLYGFLSFSLLYMAHRLLREAFPKTGTVSGSTKDARPPSN